MGRMAALLTVNLEGISNTHGKNTAVDNGKGCGTNPLKGDDLPGKSHSQTQSPTDPALNHGEDHRIHTVGQPADDHHMAGKTKSPHQLQKIPVGNGQGLGDTQQIEPHGSQKCADPVAGTGGLAPHEPEDGNDDHIQSRDEPGLARRGMYKTHLLKGGPQKKDAPCGQSSLDHHPWGRGIANHRNPVFPPFTPGKKKRHQGEPTQAKTDAIVGIGAHMVHAHALGHKGKSPYGRGTQ